jgi:hypothetical protein
MDSKRITLLNNAWFLALLIGFSACSSQDAGTGERESIVIQSAGGQSGSEGASCGIPQVEELDFDVDQAVDFVIGRHETELDIRPTWAFVLNPESDSKPNPVSMDIVQRGQPRVDLDCGGRLLFDVEITLAFQNPAIDFVFDGEVTAFSETEAVLVSTLDKTLAEHLNAIQNATIQSEAGSYKLIVHFTSDGVVGILKSSFTQGGSDECRVAVFPELQKCPIDLINESDVNTPIHGFTIPKAIRRLSDLGPYQMTKSFGQSIIPLTISLAETPQWFCKSRSYDVQIGFEIAQRFNGTLIEAPITLRVVSEDKKLDIELPSRLEVYLDGDQSWDGSMTVGSVVIIPRSLIPDDGNYFGLNHYEEDLIALKLTINVSRDDVITGRLLLHPATIDPGLPRIAEPISIIDEDYFCYGNMDVWQFLADSCIQQEGSDPDSSDDSTIGTSCGNEPLTDAAVDYTDTADAGVSGPGE